MKTKLLIVAAATMLLSACTGKLTDVNHKWCPPEKPVVKSEKISLSADALFKFDKASNADLLPEGRKTLDDLIVKLNNSYAEIEAIDLVGHTDRFGSEKYNYNLGLQRAKTVKTYLEKSGVATINVASAGETQPITQNCVGEKATKALTDCLQPDRRVTIEIKGLKKVQ